jgi:hypothetical protein
MLKKEVRDHICKYVHPFRTTNGQGFHLKDIDPADTCGVKMEKGDSCSAKAPRQGRPQYGPYF